MDYIRVGSGWNQVSSCYEQDSERPVSLICGEYLAWLRKS